MSYVKILAGLFSLVFCLSIEKVAFTQYDDYNRYPAWSPDGSQIAFISGEAGYLDVWVMNADGSDAINLTAGSNRYFIMPVWSPNGDYLAFEGYEELGEVKSDIWMVENNGDNLTNLTAETELNAIFPQWSVSNSLMFSLVSGDDDHSHDSIQIFKLADQR